MSQVRVTRDAQNVTIRNGRLLGSMSAESPALPLAESLTQQHPHLASRAYRAAMLVDRGHVAVRPGPYNVYDADRNITGRVLSQTGSGKAYTVRVAPGSHVYKYDEYAVEICDCPDFGRTKRDDIPACKHVLALGMARRLLANQGELQPTKVQS